jgi:hypothetical protein
LCNILAQVVLLHILLTDTNTNAAAQLLNDPGGPNMVRVLAVEQLNASSNLNRIKLIFFSHFSIKEKEQWKLSSNKFQSNK